MPKQFITPQRVVELAFQDSTVSGSAIAADYVTQTAIIAAQRRYILPVLGRELYDALSDGKYLQFLEEYVHPPLAMFLRAMILPDIWTQTGRGGLLRQSGSDLKSAGESELLRLIRTAKTTARALMSVCREHLDSSFGSYPEYSPGSLQEPIF